MGTIKDRNSMNLIEAEDIKKRWQEYTEELYKKNLPDQGNHTSWNAGDQGSVPGSGRSPGEGNGNALQYYCLENPMERGAW